MNNIVNLDLEKIKKQLNRSTNINAMYNKKRNKNLSNKVNKTPRKIPNVTKNVTKKVTRKVTKRKPANVPTKISRRVSSNNAKSNHTKSISWLWTFFYLALILSILFFMYMLIFNLYISYEESEARSSRRTDIIIEDKLKKAPKGVIIDQEGAPISVEKTGDITENKYLSLYGGDDYMRKMKGYRPLGNQYINSQYAPYPGRYNGYSSDRGVTKIYYKNQMNGERRKLNKFINQQNNYIRQINNRVRQINTGRMYNPTYARDKAVLAELRNYERRLANQVKNEAINQPYLPDQSGHYY